MYTPARRNIIKLSSGETIAIWSSRDALVIKVLTNIIQEKLDVKYFHYMDVVLILAQTRWKLRKAIR